MTREEEDNVIQMALSILHQRVMQEKDVIAGPDAMKQYLKVRLAQVECELFGIVFIDTKHKVIAIENMFRGTLTKTSVYPREVVKDSLRHNAAAVVLYHNHPSGSPEPSEADKQLTNCLQQALKLVDVQVLDHVVIAGINCVSFAELGLL